MKFFIVVLFIFINGCAVTPIDIGQNLENISSDPEVNMQDPTIGTGKLTIQDKERLYPYFAITLDGFSQTDGIEFSKAEKIRFLEGLDQIKFVLSSPEFRESLEAKNLRGDFDAVGSTGIEMKYDEPIDTTRLTDAVRRFGYGLTLIKCLATAPQLAAAAGVSYYPEYAYPHPLYRQVPHFYVIDLDNIEPMKGSVYINGSLDYTHISHYMSYSSLLLHEMLHNMGGMHNIDRRFEIVDGVELAYREIEYEVLTKYAEKWEAFKGYYLDKYGHLL
ncbi:MAG: hypothetical protein ACRC9L_06480 [Brevinema sp.]